MTIKRVAGRPRQGRSLCRQTSGGATHAPVIERRRLHRLGLRDVETATGRTIERRRLHQLGLRDVDATIGRAIERRRLHRV